MATDSELISYIADQISGAGPITYRKMFGEYAIYLDGKVVALVCDNQLFVKPTEAGRQYIGAPWLAAPYPGAKPHFLMDERLDDREWVGELMRITAGALPLPKPKKKRPRATPNHSK